MSSWAGGSPPPQKKPQSRCPCMITCSLRSLPNPGMRHDSSYQPRQRRRQAQETCCLIQVSIQSLLFCVIRLVSVRV
ncbi:hypothetical protein GQ53DRAFT_259881 [Thozetella sp. PMI_491]|nr:hypothetical protein GQ53DRAFT_259881 [Thozetella sp. PMI_491]